MKMLKTTSYRTKHTRLQEELRILEWSSDSKIPESFVIENCVSSPQHVYSDYIDEFIHSSTSTLSEHNITSKNIYKSFDSNDDNYSLNDIIYNQKVEVDANINAISNTHTQSCVWGENVKNKLKKWMINFNVPQNTCNALLKILKNYANLDFLPVDCHTLLQSGSSKVLNI